MPLKVCKVLLIAAILLAACTPAAAPQPTQTPLPPPAATFTAPPSPSPAPSLPPTETPASSAAPSPESTTAPEPSAPSSNPGLLLEQSTPLAEWRGLPVMPGATTAQDMGGSYAFAIQDSSFQKIRDYYETELKKLGWTLLSGGGSNKSELLIFQKEGSGTLSITIVDPGQNNGVLQVVLMK